MALEVRIKKVFPILNWMWSFGQAKKYLECLGKAVVEKVLH